MSELPAGWAPSTLGEIGNYLNGRGFKKAEWGETGRPIIRIQNLTGSGATFNYYEGEADERNTVRDGDLLVSWAATLGVFVWRGPEAVLNQHIFKVESHISQTFHRYLLTHVLADLQRQTHGSGMVHITKGRFDATPVLVPPLAEQERIVAAIEEHLSRLDAAQAVLVGALGRLGLLEIAISQSGLSEVPHRQRLDDVATLKAGPFGSALKKAYYVGSGYKIYGQEQVLRGDPHFGDYFIDENRFQQLASCEVRPGDVLISLVGTIGKTLIVPPDAEPGIINPRLIRIRADPEQVTPEYIEAFVSAPSTRALLARGSHGGTMDILNSRMLSSLEIPVPPLGHQHRVVEAMREQLGGLAGPRAIAETAVRRGRALRRSILATAFSGQLVPQDPDDEPAPRLLARIASERAEASSAKMQRKVTA